jgi:hypothetical protein
VCPYCTSHLSSANLRALRHLVCYSGLVNARHASDTYTVQREQAVPFPDAETLFRYLRLRATGGIRVCGAISLQCVLRAAAAEPGYPAQKSAPLLAASPAHGVYVLLIQCVGFVLTWPI